MTVTDRKAPTGTARTPTNIGEEWPPFLILVCLTLLFLAQTPSVPPGGQMACILAGVGGLVATIAVCQGFAENLRRAIFRAPSFLLLLLTAWTTYRYFTTPPAFRLLATTDLLRIFGGTLVYFSCAYILGTSRQLARLVIGILVFAVFVCFADFSIFSQNASRNGFILNNGNSILGLHMTVGGFLAMLLPVVAAFAFNPDGDDRQRLVAQLTFIVITFAWILAQSRSGWAAGTVALLVVAALFGVITLREQWRRGKDPRPARRNQHPVNRILNSPYLWVVLGLVVLVVGGGVSGVLSRRSNALQRVLTGNLTDGGSTVQARLNSWRGALLMIRDKPVTGFGLGGYMVEQGRYTHAGDEVIQVLRQGTGHQNRAHNYYLQTAVDSGLIGLFLHMACVSAWLFAMIRGLPVAPSPERRAFAIGAVGAVIAGMIDAVASPMYQLHGTYALQLAWMGIGLGALRSDPPRSGITLSVSKGERGRSTGDDQQAIPAPTPISDWIGSALIGAGVSLLFVYLGNRIIAEGARKPIGTFRVVTVPNVWEIRPGTRIVFKAIYKDENGVDRPTLPGTEWEVQAKDDILNAPGSGLIRMDAVSGGPRYDPKQVSHSGLTMVPPPGVKEHPITVFAIYRDEYGRVYRKASTVAVRMDAPEIVPYSFPKVQK